MKTIAGSLGILALCASSAFAVTNTQLRLQVQSFVWEEFADGDRLLKEDGPLFAIEGRTDIPFKGPTVLRGRMQLFYGEVDYDGATQAGDPVQSTTEYFGSDASIDIRYRKPATTGKLAAEPLAGLGILTWIRSLSPDDDELGYDEYWTSFYGRIGGAISLATASGWEYALEIAARLPFYNLNEVEFEFADFDETVELEPEPAVGYDAEISARKGAFVMALAYEKREYGKSDIEDISIGGFYQPESEAELVTFSAGMVF